MIKYHYLAYSVSIPLYISNSTFYYLNIGKNILTVIAFVIYIYLIVDRLIGFNPELSRYINVDYIRKSFIERFINDGIGFLSHILWFFALWFILSVLLKLFGIDYLYLLHKLFPF